MALHAAAARYTLGAVTAGDEGAAATEAAADVMRTKGVRVPMRYARMLLPGRWTP